MTRRALIGALAAVVFAVSGAGAGDGYFQKVITFTPGTIDTLSYLDGLAALVNDSLIFYSAPFGVSTPWTVCKARLFYKTADTLSTIDTIGYEIYSKFDSPYDSTWWKIGGVTKAEEDVINTTPLSMTSTTYFDADTVGIGNVFRVKFAIIAEETEWRARDVAGLVPLNATYILYLIFVDKGNQ